ncbi:LytR/AlgR family response regulator transcription factor [Clostridium sp. C105KSO13]|uniref:LytR/AlgR family response regulator transcription factor n=1 Tax=Clostridium sp. C105KSO13 TaxID=1776045 RepID=UPI0007407AAD|nr:LytTR family DNA-binding domain-containing protein [Clostridium sp. C105KSO13]CUX45888.1 Transcriptional regulatory protein YpdB [Clostridium sp. C105KSO13]
MIRIALVEDDKKYVSELKEYLLRYEKEKKEKIAVSVFSDGEDIVTDYTADFDIILMDIEMTFMDGMTAAKNIRHKDEEVIIIFITNMPQYAIEGYKVDALDYVLKPLSYFAFTQRIDRALTRLKRREKKYITIPVKGGRVKLDTSRIMFVEVADHDLIYQTVDGEYMTKGTMKDTQESLDVGNFYRCSRCYLVNMEYVDGFQGSDIMVNGWKVQVSRSRRKPFLDALNNYMNEAGK